MSRRKKALIIASVVLVVLLVILGFVGNFFFEYALKARRNEPAPGVTADEEVVGTSDRTEAARQARAWLDEVSEEVFIQSGDGLKLHGYMAENDSNQYAIVVHGYTGNGPSMAGFGQHFYDLGFNVLIPECRGHGQSEGSYIGMGWPDRLDMLRWIDFIIAENQQAEIMLYGISMGGATVMMTAGEALPPQVKLVIEDCGYSSVWEEFTAQLKEQFGLPSFPVMQAASVVTKIRAGYWLSEADAVKQVAKAQVPMLFIHGEADTFVPYWMLEPLYEAKQGVKEKFVVPGAAHGMASVVDPEGYWAAVDSFIERYM